MNIYGLFERLKKFNIKITAKEICRIWGMDETSFSRKKKAETEIKHKNITQLENFLGIKLTSDKVDILNNTKPKEVINMRHKQLLDTIQEQIGKQPLQRELADIIGAKRVNVIGNRASRNSEYSFQEIEKIAKHYQIPLSAFGLKEPVLNTQSNADVARIIYRPESYLSAGYGALNNSEDQAETISIDSKLLISDRGIRINPANCEIVNVSGNSMSPEYRHGDRVIVDKSINEFMDGYIFAFVYGDECFMKEINVIGKRIKCISLNPAYDPFYIEPGEYVKVIGRIIPRVRL